MLSLRYAPEDEIIGAYIRNHLKRAGKALSDDGILVIVLSSDQGVQETIINALDKQQHVIPIVVDTPVLPDLIAHLQPIEFQQPDSMTQLLQRIDELSAPNIPRPLTPSRRSANKQTAIALIGLVLLMFVAGLWLVGSGIAVAPEDEFAGAETQIFLTRNSFIDGMLPRTTEEATHFEATIPHMPTKGRVQLVETATAIAAGVEGTYIPQSTAEAAEYEATLQGVSTVVYDRLLSTVTHMALTAAVITPTPDRD